MRPAKGRPSVVAKPAVVVILVEILALLEGEVAGATAVVVHKGLAAGALARLTNQAATAALALTDWHCSAGSRGRREARLGRSGGNRVYARRRGGCRVRREADNAATCSRDRDVVLEVGGGTCEVLLQNCGHT